MLLFGYKSMLLFGNNQIFLKFFLIFFLARYVFIAVSSRRFRNSLIEWCLDESSQR